MAERPLRFAMVTTFYPPYHFGGDAVCVFRLSEALAQRGHKVDVIHSIDAFRLAHRGDPPVEFKHHPNVRCHGLESPQPLVAALTSHQLGRPGFYDQRLRSILKEQRPDVIHFHNISLMGGPGVLAWGDGVKLYTAHEYWLVCPTHVLFRFGREACTKRTCWRCTLHARRPLQLWRHTKASTRALEHVDRLLFPSRFAAAQHRAQGIETPMEVLPHFVPQPAERRPADAEPYFLFVGRLEKIKGVQDILPLFTGPTLDAELVIVGEGTYGAELRRQAERLGARVRFVGAKHPAELTDLYRRAVALIAPSLCYETFGMTVAEAFAHGIPAVARNHGALAELIEENGAGYAFRTPEECGEALARVLADPAHRAELGERGRLAVRDRYGEEAHIRRYLALVDEVSDGTQR